MNVMNIKDYQSRDNIKIIENEKNQFKSNYENNNLEYDNGNFQNKINKSYELKPKYRLNFSKIIKNCKIESENKSEYQNIELKCNICINSTYIDIANKIKAISLLTLSNYDTNFNYFYYLNNKIIKYYNQNNGIANFIFIKSILKASKNLLSQNNYFYAFFLYKIAKQISQKSKIDNNSQNNLTNLYYEIKESIYDYIAIKQSLLMNLDNCEMEKIDLVKQLIDNIGKENYKNDTLYYVINGKWVQKAKIFFDEYERIKKKKDNEIYNFLQESFDNDKMYEKYVEKDINENIKIFFPGPINNYEITFFNDFWEDTSPYHIQDNYYIKKNLILNKDYYLINQQIWNNINQLFESTNELLKRGNDDNDSMLIKCIIFDNILQEKNNINHLRRKYIQISKNSSVYDFKLKLLRVIQNFKKENDTEEKSNENINKIIKFYELPYNQKDILSEIIIAYSNKIESIKCDIMEINVNDRSLMKDFPCDGLRNNNYLLLIEIVDSECISFLNEKNKICIECQKIIELEYKCDKCHLFEYCSEECFKINKYHKDFHSYYDEYLIEEFSLKKIFDTNISNEIPVYSNHGISGLINLGNTCYLNSVIQCLSNTIDLTKYFLFDYYQQEMNMGNKLGSFGLLATSYSQLINELWIEKTCDPINPKEFLNKVKKEMKLLSNHQQQDAHEFLSLFLDLLHEDINRINNRKYMELKERLPNENDEKASKRWWNIYKSRDNSIITDLFYGQFKSEIKCVVCNKSSITYDPFMILELPLPSSQNETTIKFFYRKDCYFFNYSINKESTIIDLKNKCFELDVLLDYNNDDNKILLIEAVVLDKNKVISKIINNNNELVFDYLDKGEEIIFFKKDTFDSFLIYCYPINFINDNGFFFKEKKINYLSYPVALSVNFNTTIEDLNSIIQSEFSDMINFNSYEIPFDLLIYHNNVQKGFSLFSTLKCEFCGQKYDSYLPFCSLNSQFSNNETIGLIISKLENHRPFILFFSSEFYKSTEYYKNMPLSFSDYISQPLIVKKKNSNIYDSLDLFKNEEKLYDNKWFCHNCKSHKKAAKQSILYKAPNYLIIHLKRFLLQKSDINSYTKNRLFMDFPINNLDLSNSVIGPDRKNAMYNLYGVVEHYGNLYFGHYIAKCKNFDYWYEYNDSFVKRINEKNVVTDNAYILFYKKKVLNSQI